MKRVILYSDNSNLLALLHTLLIPGGAAIVEVKSRKALAQRCMCTHFDKIITDDVRMFLNGSNLLDTIRSSGARPHIFILSTDISEHSVLSLLEEGVTEFLTLPIGVERLQKKLLK